MNKNPLQNLSALVCGSTQGIGKATAFKLAEMGCNVTIIARDEVKLKQLLKELPKDQNQFHQMLCADFRNPKDLKKKIQDFISNGNVINILINNTSGPKGGPIISATIDEFLTTFNQHLICNHILVQTLCPGMVASGYGRIINVISTSVKQPLPNLGVSNTIRGAVANWSKTLANELGQFGITVNNVLPGATNTSRLQNIAQEKSLSSGQSIESIWKEISLESPMKRIAQPEEIASAIGFLASPEASYINGINLPVDGGRTKNL